MVRFESRTVAQISAEKERAMRIVERRLEEVPERLAALVEQGVIGSQMAEELKRIHGENEDGICPVADQIYRLLDVFNNPQTVGEARYEADLILAVNRRYSANG